MASRAAVHIGTSGWHYDHWRGPFYPPEMAPEDFLSFYVRHFASVEINNSFYQLPSRKTFEVWRDTVPEGFVFSVKASRYITHMKKLKGAQEAVDRFLERVAVLREKLGPILFQLPPRWRCNAERLSSFLQELPVDNDYAFEFRDTNWFREEILEVLRDHGAAFCIYDLNGRLSPIWVTAPFVYVRLHGPAGPYQGCYTDEELGRWAAHIRKWKGEGKEVYIYFDNDEAGYAVRNALDLKARLEGDR